MKNNFLSLVTKMPQNTGGGNSQTKRATFALPLRYLCAMLLAFFLGVGQMWGATVTPSTGSHPNAFYSITSITTAQTMSTSSATNPGSREITSGATITGGKAYVGVKYTSNSTKGLTLNNSNCWKIDQNYIWCILNSTDAFVAGDTIFISNGATNAYAVSLNRATNATGDYTSNSSTYTASSSSPAKGSEYYFVLPSNFVSSNYLVINKSSSGNVDFSYVYACHASADPVCPGTLTITGTKAYTEGQKIELTASLSAGNGDITYQWYKGSVAAGNAISGATNAKYEKASCVLADAGDYFCVASKDGCDSKTNAEAYTVTVSEAPFSGDASDLVTISAEYTFIPSETLTHGYLYYGKKLYSCGGSDLSYSADNKIKFSTSRKMAIKVAAGAHIKVTYNTSSSRYFYIGTTDGGHEIAQTNTGSVEGDYAAGGVVYLSASGDLNMTKLEITYPAPASAAPSITAHPSTSAAQYFKDATATALTVTATGSGTLTYQWYKNTTNSNASGTAIDGATSASYTPSTAEVGTLYYYCAVTNTESGKSATTVKSNVSGAIKTVAAPLGVIDQKLATGNVAWDASVIVTSDYTNITSLTALSQHGTATASGNGNTSNGGQTSKIGTATGDFNDANYLELAFTVKSGMEFEVSSVTIPVQPVTSGTNNFKAVLSDGTTDIEGTSTNLEAGKLNNISFGSYGTLKGNVTLKIYAWGWGDGYRLGKNIVIDGELKAPGACTTPTIAWDGDQPADAYVSDGSKTFKVTSNYTDGVALELSENTCGATIAAKSGSDNKQWVVSFTGAGSVKVTPKVVGDGTTVCATTVSAAAKTLTVTLAHDVTFNMNGHGASIAKQVVADGGKATAPYVADVADWVFGGWYTDAECTAGNEFDFANTTITADKPLYAKWTADACAGDRKSLSRVVLTSATEGTVTGYNGDEYAGAAVIDGLSDGQTADVDASHDGVETGYKMNGKGSAIVFATLKKGTFQEGDRVIVTITKKNDAYKEGDVAQNVLHLYFGTNASDATKLTTLEGVSAAGSYTYRLTAADVAAIGEKKGIGVFRESSNGQNPYVYSVEITGCRSFAVTHDVNFNMMDHGDAITKQTIEVGAKVTEPAEPEAVGYIFGGWYKENTLVNKWNFSTDVMPDNDITLYAKWSEDPCTDRQSLVKVTMTAYNNASVAGYNNNEYAGGKIINGLSSSDENKNTADLGAGDVTGYKLSSNKYCVFATLAKGSFHVGDKVVIGMTGASGSEKIPVYAAKDKDNVALLGYIEGASAAGYYTYRLNSAAIDIINAAGEDYKSIGVYRTSSDYNLFIYSIELTGCREWTIYHSLTFMNIDGTATIAAEPLEEGAYASTVAPAAPKIALKRFKGWSESIGGTTVDLTSYTITEDKTLYAVYEDIVCPTTGTVYKFEIKDELPSENLPTSTDKDMSSYITATGDGYLTYTATANNKATINSDGTIQMKDPSAAYLKVELECALAAGDQIRAHVTNNPIRVQVGTTYDSNKDLILAKNAYEFVAITSAMEGKQVLYITRSSNGNANLADFEIYRPAKYDVSFNMMGHGSAIADLEDVVEGSKIAAPSPAPTDVDYSFAGWYKENTLENEWKFDVDVVETNTTLYAKWLDKSDATLKSLKYGETDIVLVVDQDTYDITLPSLTSSVPALTAETNNPNATKLIANGTFDGAGNATSTVTVTPEVGANKVYTVNFARGIALEQVTVTTSMEWDWSAAGVTAEINNTNTPGLSGNDVVIANVPGVKNDADFNSQALKASGTYAIRTEYFQGKVLNFKTDKEGLLIVDFGGTNGNARVLKVYDNADNEIAAWNYNSEARQVQQVVVPAGGVTLKAFEGASGNNARIYNLKFYALAYTRDDDWMAPGELGTVCYPEGLVAVGAEMYKMAGVDDNNKFVFDEVSVLDPGKPYLFVAQSNVLKFYATTATAAGAAGTNNGMVGTFVSIDLSHTDARAAKWYYFSGKKFYAVSKRTSDLNVPANRAYVDMNTPVLAGAPKHGVRRITFDVQGTNIATGVENAAATDKPAKMLINGQLFILRGEKMYDAKGQLVK